MTLFAKRITGTMLLLIGVAGVFLPLMPGVIFIILGSQLLKLEQTKWQKRATNKHENKQDIMPGGFF
ncbi:MAG: hypothetical protein ACE5HO_19460 [bacterium]